MRSINNYTVIDDCRLQDELNLFFIKTVTLLSDFGYSDSFLNLFDKQWDFISNDNESISLLDDVFQVMGTSKSLTEIQPLSIC